MSPRALVIGTAFGLCCSSALAASESAAGPEAAVQAVFAAHEQALNSHDLEALMGLYAPGDGTVVMGTTPPERWVGAAQISDAYQNFFKDFDAGTVTRDCPWTHFASSGDVGWISANCEYQDSRKGETRTFALNITAVVQQLDGAWKLRTMHFSNPVAP